MLIGSKEAAGSLASSSQWLHLSPGLGGLALSSQMPQWSWGLASDTSLQSRPQRGLSLPSQFHILQERMAGLRSCAHRVCVRVCVRVHPNIREEGVEDQ